MASSSPGSGGAGKSAASSASRRPVHAHEAADAGNRGGRAADLLAQIVGVDHHGRRVIGEVIVQLIGEAHVDERRNRADAPAGEQCHQVVHAVVRHDADAVALAHPQMMQGAGAALHGVHGLREGERDLAVDPAQCNLVGTPHRAVDEKLVHQHAASSFSIAAASCLNPRPKARRSPARFPLYGALRGSQRGPPAAG